MTDEIYTIAPHAEAIPREYDYFGGQGPPGVYNTEAVHVVKSRDGVYFLRLWYDKRVYDAATEDYFTEKELLYIPLSVAETLPNLIIEQLDRVYEETGGEIKDYPWNIATYAADMVREDDTDGPEPPVEGWNEMRTDQDEADAVSFAQGYKEGRAAAAFQNGYDAGYGAKRFNEEEPRG